MPKERPNMEASRPGQESYDRMVEQKRAELKKWFLEVVSKADLETINRLASQLRYTEVMTGPEDEK